MAKQRIKFRTRTQTRIRYRSRRARRRGGRRSVPIAQTLAGVYGLSVLAAEYNATLANIMAGNLQAAVTSFKTDSARALAVPKLVEAGTPFVVTALAAKGARMAGVPTPKAGKFRLF